MALQVWLPLNGNLNNQGLATITHSGSPTYIAGKTGQALSLANKVQFTDLPKLSKFTIAFWAKVDSCTVNWADLIGFTSKQSDGASAASFRFEATISTRACSFHNNTPYAITQASEILITEAQKGTWHHCCFSYSGTQCWIYVDGIHKYTHTGLNGYLINEFHIGETGAIVGGMNDLRIYDECLTYKQIKELAKGLVIHYPLQTKLPITNMAKNKSFSVYNNLGIPYTLAKTGERFKGAEVWRLTMTPRESDLSSIKKDLYAHGVSGFSQTFLANTKYSFWVYYKPITHNDIRVGGTASNINGWKENAPVYESDGWYRVGQYRDGSVTTDKKDSIFTSFYCPSAAVGVPISIDFCAPYLIKDSTSIIAYDDYQIDSITVEYDVSGNGYDATINTVQPLYQADAPRHSGSYNFTNNNQYLYKTALNTSGFTNTWTFTWWSKASSMANKMAWGFSDGNRLNLYPSTYFCMNTGDGSNNPFRDASGTSVTFNKYEDNLWHFYTVTGDGSSNKLYIDGQLIGTSKTYKGITGTNLYISGWDTGTSYRWIGSLSDFRLYSTPLSADDIKQMYYTGAYVDNDGYIGAYEFMEVE